MSELVIETTGLRKTYVTRRGRQVALDGLDLAVPRGGVHGFLGPNGSGKTTTIRMVLGLSRADAGTMRLFGTEVPQHLPSVIDRVGAVVEQPRLFPAFSGRRNLLLLARTIGTDGKRVDEVLETVGLRERGKDRYKAYSLGMKQRLAIAATLLKKPDLLVLDEPTVGLDPVLRRDLWGLFHRLAAGGQTLLVSSHVMDEADRCDRLLLLRNGELLAEGTPQALRERTQAADVESAFLAIVDGARQEAMS